jgi:signal transduction histidine kinase
MRLRVLIVEDSPADAELVVLELRRAGFAPEPARVDTPAAMNAALDADAFDVVIADYRLPGWSGLGALKLVQERELDLPFIVVSGAIGEETAVEAMRGGAHDYVLKDNLTRLGPAVTRELREAQVRLERRQALAALKDMARRSALLAEASRRLASSLNFEDTLIEAARVAVPEVADWCLVTWMEEWPRGLRASLAHAEPAKEALGRAHLERFPLELGADRGPAQVIRAGRAEPTSADDVLVTAAAPEERQAVLRALGHHEGVCLPLQSRDRTMGALTLVWTSPRRSPGADQQAFEQELAARAAMALENATLYRQARDAVRAREEFLSVASHELNTPLATLTLHVDDLLERDGGASGSSEEAAASRRRARRQLERLSRLVGNLLDISRLDARRLQLRRSEVDLAAATREVVDQFQPELARAGCPIRVEAAGPVVGQWDALRVTQIITNLLSNAAKYGAGKPIAITVQAMGDKGRVVVQDHGPGIAPEELEHLFERFGRTARQYGGLGLGLYITRQVVEAHGGTIKADSQPGAGATFTVELPLRPPRAEAREGA